MCNYAWIFSKDMFWDGFWCAVFFTVVISVSVGGMTVDYYRNSERKQMEHKAIENGVGYYECDKTTGEVTFKWRKGLEF